MAKKKQKVKWGDRRDGVWLRDLDPLHTFSPYMFINRADNEAFISETVDLTAVNAYLEKKNAENPEYKYTFFHILCAALVKVITLRPKMNRFISGRRFYQRNEIILSFVVKKMFNDNAEEALAYIPFPEDSTVDSVHNRIMEEIHTCRRTDIADNSTDKMGKITKLPRPLLRFAMAIITSLDNHGRAPYELVKTDPNHATAFISNLGSIGLKAGYHHLTNWGTTSIFIVIGEKKPTPFFKEDGTFEMREALNLGLTLDERIADGYYYSKTVKLLKHLLQNPELLEQPANTEVDY